MTVRFGIGALEQLGEVLAELRVRRVVAFITPSQQSLEPRLGTLLNGRLAGTSYAVRPRVPAEIARAGRDLALASGADGLLAVGGGSAIGVAKAITTMIDTRLVAVPTTYSGSELTDIYGITVDGSKVARHDSRVRPRAVVYDPELTYDLPAALTATSGINALAHGVGSLLEATGDATVTRAATDGIRLLMDALPTCVRRPRDVAARTAALSGARHAATALAATGLSRHHELAHALGDLTGLPHAGLHAVLLPQTSRLTADEDPIVAGALEAAIAAQPATAIFDLVAELGAPTSLAQLGLSSTRFAAARQRLLQEPPGRWRRVRPSSFDDVLTRAYVGARPFGSQPPER